MRQRLTWGLLGGAERRRACVAGAIGFLLAFAPAMVLGWLVDLHSVNTPVWDDWERGPLIEKFKTGTLTFADLYAPHIDHRIFFPRLLILALNELTRGDIRWEIGATFLCGVTAALGVWRLGRLTLFNGGTLWGVVFAANLIILSPIQWDNWLWGIQVAFLLPMTCLVWALVAMARPWEWWKKFIACSGLAIVATHSFGHGFVVWPAVLGMALLARNFGTAPRHRWLFVGCWLACATAVLACYTLVDFKNTSDSTHSYGKKPGESPPGASNWKVAMESPLRASQFFLTLAGNAFARMHLVDPVDLAPWIGGVMCGLLVLMVVWWFARRSQGDTWDRALPWMALAGAALAGTAAVTVGRLDVFGFSRAVSIRYISISQYLPVSLLFLGVLWWRDPLNCLAGAFRQRWGGVILGVFAGFMIPAWNHGAQMMRLCGQARLQGRAALMFINHFDPDFPWRIDATIEFPRKYAKVLDRYGLLEPPLVRTLDLKQFNPVYRDWLPFLASVENLTRLPDGTFDIEGFAYRNDRPADAVLLTRETSASEPEIFAVAETCATMVAQPYPNDLELVGRLKPDKRAHFRWRENFSHAQLGFCEMPGQSSVIVRAWILDVRNLRAHRIRGAWRIDSDGVATRLSPDPTAKAAAPADG